MVMQLGRISRYTNMAIRANLMKSFIFLLKVVLQKLPLEGSSTDVGSMIRFCFLLRSTNELNNLTKIEQHPAQYEAEIYLIFKIMKEIVVKNSNETMNLFQGKWNYWGLNGLWKQTSVSQNHKLQFFHVLVTVRMSNSSICTMNAFQMMF